MLVQGHNDWCKGTKNIEQGARFVKRLFEWSWTDGYLLILIGFTDIAYGIMQVAKGGEVSPIGGFGIVLSGIIILEYGVKKLNGRVCEWI